MKNAITAVVFVLIACCSLPAFSQSNDEIFDASNPAFKTFLSTVDTAKKTSPKRFAAVPGMAEDVVALDKKKRGPFVPLAQSFKAAGPAMSLPLASYIFEQYRKPTLKGSARVSFMVGAFESFAHHQTQAVVPLLFAVLQTENDPYIVRAASEAVGRVGTDAQVVDLIAFADGSADVRLGMRGCRRTACAMYFDQFLMKKRATIETSQAVKTLGSIGNSWAWKTDEVKSKDDGEAVRRFAAKVLVREFVEGDAQIRREARKAILVVDHPSTPDLITTAKQTADADTRKARDALFKKFENNPVR